MNTPAAEVVLAEIDGPLFAGSPYPILIVDRQSGAVSAANRAATLAYGYDETELRGLPIGRLWPKAEPLLRRGARFDWGARTWRHRRKSGEWMVVSIAVQELPLAERAALALHISDVTERELSVALLEGQGRVLEMVARGSPLERIFCEILRITERLCAGMLGSVLVVDAGGARLRHGAAPSLPPEYWKAADGIPIGPTAGSCGAAAYSGRQVIVDDIAAHPLWDDYRQLALPHGLRACWSTPILSRCRRVLGVFAMYYREPRTPDERELRLVRAATDLTAIAIERDLADRELQESEGRLRAIVDQAHAVVFVKDLEGRYTLVNRRFEEVTGTPQAAVLGKVDADIFPGAVAERFSASDRTMLESGATVEFEEAVRLAEEEHVYLTAKFPLRHADGTPYGMCGISTDITERKNAERALEVSAERLRALTARLQGALEAERTRIAREVHDLLGQMLTALRMKQSLLARRLRENGAAMQAAAVAVELDAMHALSGEILSSVSRIAAQLRPQVLDSLGLEAALEWQAAEFARDAGIACEVSLPPRKVPMGTERATALFRIFQEALTNVARHSGASRVRARLREAGGAVELVVEDNGRGITKAERCAVTSLGLLGMRERAAMLGGETIVGGAPGGGTVVTVRLPSP